jgi:SAM-dependent methyltransferase
MREAEGTQSQPGLVVEQYRDDQRLRSRYAVHEQFSTAELDYLEWIFEYLAGYEPASIFDLGCGPGYIWQHNAARLPEHYLLRLGDRSAGMLARASEKLGGLSTPVDYVQLEAEWLPFSANQFDAVLCLHVLHHLKDVHVVLEQVRRVLEPGGKLLAATNGDQHMHEFREALKNCGVQTEYFKAGYGFSLEHGRSQLLELFDRVECIHFSDALLVTQVEPLMAYARSGIPEGQEAEQDEALTRLESYWQFELKREGAIHIQKQAGIFIAE